MGLKRPEMKKYLLMLLLILALILSISSFATLPPPPPNPPSIDDVNITPTSNTTAESCSDSIQNQNETDVDCGGSCQKCGNQENCRLNSDCESNYCNPNLKCALPSCFDSFKNQGETDIDCGGACEPCSQATQPVTQSGPDLSSSQENINLRDSTSGDGTVADFSNKETQEITDNEEPAEKISLGITGAPKGSYYLTISLVSNAVLLILFIGFIIFHHATKSKNQSLPAGRIVEADIIKIKQFIENSYKIGYDKSAIRQALVKAKYPKETIEAAFNMSKKW